MYILYTILYYIIIFYYANIIPITQLKRYNMAVGAVELICW